MKLIIILSVVACSYAAKLDRGYLPPANAASAGGTPGSLTAPGFGANLQSGPSSFTQAIEQGLNAQSGALQSKPGFGSASQYQPSASGPQFGQSGISSPGATGSAFGQAPTAFSGNQGSFENQGPQDTTAYSGQYQPERAQASVERNSETLRSDSQNDGDNFAYSFETSNGITAEESGVATNGVQAQGGYSYTGDDGQQYRVTYTADENGYQPQGEHLPTPHPIPEEILRSLEENARAAAAGTQEGAYQPEEESNFGPQQYNNGAQFYEKQTQVLAQAPSAYNQGRQPTNSQYNTPSAPRPVSAQLSGSQGYQYQAGSNQGPSQNAPTAPGFSFPRGQAPVDQGPSPSTPTASNVFAPSGSRQPTQNQGQFGATSPAISGLAHQGQASGQSGYQYNRPGDSSQFSRISQPGQSRPQETGAQPSGSIKPQLQGPAYSTPHSFGSANGPSIPSGQAQGPSNQVFSPAQSSNARGPANGPTFGSSGRTSLTQGSSYPSANGAQTYALTDPSASPSTPQGSAFRRPLSFSNDNGYAYGPGLSSGSIAAKTTGQGFAPSGPFGPARSSGSPQDTFPSGPIVQNSASNVGFAPQGSRPSAPESAFSRPNGANAAQGSFGSAPQYQSSQPQESTFSKPNGSFAPKAQGPFGAGPQYQPNQSAPSAQLSQGSAFPRPNGSAAGPNGSAPGSQGPNSSMPNQSAPYQYNKPEAQGSQTGSQPGFRTPEGRPGQTFGEIRQPPSFSPEEGYKY